MGARPRVVTIVHTSFAAVGDLTSLFAELGPELTVRHIVDDSLLPEVLAHGGVTDAVRSRISDYFRAAERAGADLVFSQCSSVGEAAALAARGVGVPVVRMDERMARVACEAGPRIGVVATLETTLGPTGRLLEATGRALGRRVEIERALVEGAFDRLTAGDRAGHNHSVLSAIRALADRVDAVVCAQGSMAAILEELGETSVPVLTSPRLGVSHAVEVLRGRA